MPKAPPWTRRSLLASACAGALTLRSDLARAGLGVPQDDALFATLDATGYLDADLFDPRRAIASIEALLLLEPAARQAALRRYLSVRPSPPSGLFAVLRCLVEIPQLSQVPEPWPGVLQQGYLRPPALGASQPEQPADRRDTPLWPVVLIDDVPLVPVRGYLLAGHPEPLSMHLDGLSKATWRTRPLNPTSPGSVRYTLVHWGRFAADRETSALLEAQLQRLEG